LTVNVANLTTVNFLLFIKSQFKTDAQIVSHMNQLTQGHV